jgi:EmrB/QacA subfamily drug resistance transporter
MVAVIQEEPVPPQRRRWITVGVMTGMFLAALGGLAHFSWVFSAYLLTSTVSVPLWGKLSDLHGRRLFYQLAIGVFIVGSVLSGMARSMPQLIAARALQGLGAGGLIPLGMTIIGDIFTVRERARMQGLFSGVWGLSSIIGPLVGGFITDNLSWRWVFYINVPFGIAGAIIIGLSLREPRRDKRPVIDYLGAVVLTTAVTLLMLVLVESESAVMLLRPRNLMLLAVVVALVVWFIRIERHAPEPVVPLELFSNRVVALAMVIGFLAGVAMFGAISFIPLYAQGARGVSATVAGTFLTPLLLAWVIASIIGGRLLIRLGSKPLVLAGLIAMVAGFAGLSLSTRLTPMSVLVAELIVIGMGLGLTMLTLLISVQHAEPKSQLGIATSLNQFFRSIGGAMGVALLGAVLTSGLAANLRRAASAPNAPITMEQAASLSANPTALVDVHARAEIGPAALVVLQESLGRSIRSVFFANTLMVVIALLCGFLLPQTRPAAEDEGERMVMAEMTVIDSENEPECC